MSKAVTHYKPGLKFGVVRSAPRDTTPFSYQQYGLQKRLINPKDLISRKSASVDKIVCELHAGGFFIKRDINVNDLYVILSDSSKLRNYNNFPFSSVAHKTLFLCSPRSCTRNEHPEWRSIHRIHGIIYIKR